MPQQLKNLQITEISFVKAGANGLEFIAKDAAAPPLMVSILKTDAAKKAVYGVVYEPGKVDTQGELATAEEIEKAAWGALQSHAVIKADHTDQVAAFLAESYIAKQGDPDGYAEGAWAVVVKVVDDALWTAIAKGDYKAFSMGGMAEKAPAGKVAPQPTDKSVNADSMIYASTLSEALKVLQAVAAALGESVAKFAEVAPKAQPAAPPELGQKLDKALADLAAMQATVAKIAETTTDGRVTSPAPGGGAPAVDPSKY
jgi:hypothetical protein